jgi:hypothetical protein
VNLFDVPAKARLQKKFESNNTVVQNLMNAMANIECGSCDCEYDVFYKTVLQSKDLLFVNC